MSVQVVNSGPGVIKVSVETTPAITVTSPEVSPVEVTAGLQGETGPQGATGPQGPAGADGADGQGVPAGGDQYQVLRKVSGTDYDTEWDYADRVTLEVRFDEAVSKGDPLYITGFNNGQNRIAVAKADASDSSKMPSIGLAFADYSQNDNGQATAMGSLDDVNTQVSPNDFQEGDVLYVKAGGGLTNVKPTGTNLIQNVGKVGRRQQNSGEIVVMAIGRSNDIPNIQEGYIWAGNSSGVATATDTAYIDIANSRVGIGTTSPTEKLHVSGKIRLNDGNDNVLVGSSWGSLTTASNTVAVGYTALSSLTTGGNNTAVGADALFTNATGDYNTALGFAAARQGSRSNDVSLGYRAGIYGIGTSGNVSIGFRAGEYVSDIDNVLIGNQAGFGASDSSFGQTVAVGAFALQQLTTGADNVAVGYAALNDLTTGSNNTAVGYRSLESATLANSNTAVGHRALDSVTTGNSNTVLGRAAGAALSIGQNNVLIGNSAGATLSADSNKLYIENSSSNDPLIYGEFDNDIVRVNGDVEVGKIQSNGPERALTITGYSAAKLKFDLHSGFGRPEFSADFSGRVKFTNQGSSSTQATLQIGESSSREGAIRMFSNNENAIQIGNNAGYSVVDMGIVEASNDYSGGLKIKTRSGVTTTSDFFFSKDGELGVGTASPDEALHVVGQIKVDDGANPYTLPAADGSPNQVLQTDGSGVLTFVDQTTDTDTNIGNSDQTLSAERTIEMGGNSLVFDNSSTEVAKIFPQGYIQAKGRTIVNGNGSIGGLISLKDADSSNGVTLRCPTTVSSDLTLVLPDSDGSSGDVLKTDGSGNLSFGAGASRGGTYEYSGYSTDVTKTATFYYQFPSATATSSSTDMISGFVGQGISHGTYGSNGALTLDGLSSTDSATYSITVKVTTNTTIAIQTLSPVSGQFTPSTQFAFSSPSEQTITLTQTTPTACLSQAGSQWVLGLFVTFFAAGSIDFRVEDLSITVS